MGTTLHQDTSGINHQYPPASAQYDVPTAGKVSDPGAEIRQRETQPAVVVKRHSQGVRRSGRQSTGRQQSADDSSDEILLLELVSSRSKASGARADVVRT